MHYIYDCTLRASYDAFMHEAQSRVNYLLLQALQAGPALRLHQQPHLVQSHQVCCYFLSLAEHRSQLDTSVK